MLFISINSYSINLSDKYSFKTVAESKELLLTWHELDPVDSFEANRNEVAYSIQGNRNPFIDHPECASLIWGKVTIKTTNAQIDVEVEVLVYFEKRKFNEVI